MRNVWTLIAVAALISFAACNNDDENDVVQRCDCEHNCGMQSDACTCCNSDVDEPAAIENGTYVGTLVVDQNDETFYVQEDVSVIVTINEGSVDIKMMQVSFSERMPVKLDMTIPGATLSEIEGAFSVSGEGLIPLAMGGGFPAYTITGLGGEITAENLSFEMICGAYPTSFSGTKIQAE